MLRCGGGRPVSPVLFYPAILTHRRVRDRLATATNLPGEENMSAISRTALFLLACFVLIPLDAAAWDRGRVERFATLPEGAPNPEGITADGRGNIYVTGFNPFAAPPGKLFVFDDDGDLAHDLNV